MTWTLDAVCDAGRDLNLKKREQHKMSGGGVEWWSGGGDVGLGRSAYRSSDYSEARPVLAARSNCS